MFEIQLPDPLTNGSGRVAVRPGCWLCLTAHCDEGKPVVLEKLIVYNPFPLTLWLDVYEGCEPALEKSEGPQTPGFLVAWQARFFRPKGEDYHTSVPLPPSLLTEVEIVSSRAANRGTLFAVRMQPPDPVTVPAGEDFVRRFGSRTVHAPRRAGDARDPQPGGSDSITPPEGVKVVQTAIPPGFVQPAHASLPPWLRMPAPVRSDQEYMDRQIGFMDRQIALGADRPAPEGISNIPAASQGTPAPPASNAEAAEGVLTIISLVYRVLDVCDAPVTHHDLCPDVEGTP